MGKSILEAYFVAEVVITDSDSYARYADAVPSITAKYGGRYQVRGGNVTALEGEWHPERFIVIVFPTMEAAKAWYYSAEYQQILPIRLNASRSRAFFVSGV